MLEGGEGGILDIILTRGGGGGGVGGGRWRGEQGEKGGFLI